MSDIPAFTPQEHTKVANTRVTPFVTPPRREAEPEDSNSSGRNVFPLGALPSILRDVAKAGASASNTSVTLTAPLVLAACSLALGAGVGLHCGGSLSCHGNLYLLGIAESGTGKSEALKVIYSPLKEAQKAAVATWEQEIRPRHKARAALLKKEETKRGNDMDERELAESIRDREAAEKAASDKARPLLYAADATREALAGAFEFAPNQAFAIANADARGLIGVIAGKYSGASDEDIYLAGFSGDAMSSLRVGSGYTNVESPCLSMCLLIQPDVFSNLQDQGIFMDSGWIQRCLLFDSKARFTPLSGAAPGVPPEIQSLWQRLLNVLLENFRGAEGKALIYPSEATQEFMLRKGNEIRARMDLGDLKDIVSFSGRWAEQANRLALILHSVHFESAGAAAAEPLHLHTMEDAWIIMKWFIDEQLHLLGPVRGDKTRKRLEKLLDILIREGADRELPRWQLKDRGYDETELMRLAQAFPTRLKVGESPSGGVGKGGRKKQWIRAVG